MFVFLPIFQVQPEELTKAQKQELATLPARFESYSSGDVKMPKHVLLREPVVTRDYERRFEVTLRMVLDPGFYVIVVSTASTRTRSFVLRILQPS